MEAVNLKRWPRKNDEASIKARQDALGANRIVMGERELARGMTEYSLRSLGVPAERARAVTGRDTPVDAEGT